MDYKNSPKDLVYNRAKIKVGYLCDNDCLFCKCKNMREHKMLEKRKVAEKILLASKSRYEMILFSGGEPTSHEHLPIFVALAKKLGLKSGLITNGRKLSKRNYLQKLVDSGLRYVQITLLGSSEMHNFYTGNDHSYVETMAAIDLLHERKIELCVNFVLTSKNKDELIPLARKLSKYAPVEFNVSMLDPVSLDDSNIDHLPSLADYEKSLVSLFAYIENEANFPKSFKVNASGFPLCILREYIERSNDLKRENLVDVSDIFDASFKRSSYSGRIKPPKCSNCRFYEECLGIYETYVQLRGDDELRPEIGAISNSFAYEPVEIIDDFNIEACPVLAGKLEISEAERKILLQKDNKVEVYRTDSADFSEDKIDYIKREIGQIYDDRSGMMFHQDFENELVKLVPHETCVKCEKYESCPALFVDVGKNVFSIAEKEIIDLISQISGKTLDVGGGPLRYADMFGEYIDSGRLDYQIVEPNPSDRLIKILEKHKVQKKLYKGFVENYQADSESFDWILVLRSHNHLYDLDEAYRNMYNWLKPDGQMIVMDNTVYGVVRQKVWDKIRSEGGITQFEHYNNHSLNEAIPYMENAGFKLIDGHDVDMNTANQWWCLMKK